MNVETERAQWRLCPLCGREQVADKQIVPKLLASGSGGTERYAEDHMVSSKQVTELRKYPRLPISFPLFARGVDANGKPFKVLLTALNVSASGILVLTSSKLVPARRMQIELPVGVVAQEARQTSREVHAEVVRVEQRARSKLVGLRFGRRIA